MKIKIILYTICIFLFITLQSTILDYAKVYNVKPNLLIVFIVSVTLLRGSVEGAAVGFFAGLSQDIATGKILGFYAILGMYLGLIVGSVNRRLYRENVFVIMFFTFISTFLYESTVYILGPFLEGQMDLMYPVRYIILPESIYNCIISIFMFILVIRISDRIEKSSKIARKY